MSNEANSALPGGPNSPLQRQGVFNYVLGLDVDQANLLPDAESQRNGRAEVLSGLLNTYNAMPMDTPVVISFTGLTVTVGGDVQRLFVQGRLVDNIPQQSYTAAAGAGSDRYDLISVKYSLIQVSSGRTQNVMAPGGSINPTAINLNEESVTWNYTAGTPGAGVPATPSGYEAFASVYIPASASSISSVNVLFSTMWNSLYSGTAAQSTTNSTPLPGGVILKWGQVVGVPSDASADGVISYPTAFKTTTLHIWCTIDDGASWQNVATMLQVFNITASGAHLRVGGGSTGHTVTVRYLALGY